MLDILTIIYVLFTIIFILFSLMYLVRENVKRRNEIKQLKKKIFPLEHDN